MPDFLERHDPCLQSLRDEPEFKEIVKEAQLGSAKMRALVDEQLAQMG